MNDSTAVKLRILGKEIQVACQKEERDDLMRAAEYLNTEMESVKSRGGNPSTEKIAIITAMNMANELLSLRDHNIAVQRASTKLSELQHKIAEALK